MISAREFLLVVGLLIMLAATQTDAYQETFSGSVLASDKKTWIDELFITNASLSVVRIAFHFIVETSGSRCNPIIYLRHEHQRGYGFENQCFTLGEYQFVGPFDVRLMHKEYNDGRCNTQGDLWTCLGHLNIANGYAVRRTVSLGYRCEEACHNIFLELAYNITVLDVPQVPCQAFELDTIPGDYQNAKDVMALCQAIYPAFSPINLFGMNLLAMNRIFTAAPNIVNIGCYQYTEEIVCRSMFPECRNLTMVYPCRDMCDALMEACESEIRQADFPIECNTMQFLANDSSCVQQDVRCSEPGNHLPHGEISHSDSPLAYGHGWVIRYNCHAPYTLNTSGERTCQLSGQWSSGEPACLFPEVIIITLALLGSLLLVVFLAGFIYHFQLEIRVLIANHCITRAKYKVTAKCADVKAFHAFLCFAEEDFHSIVRPLLSELEDKHNYRLCIHQRNFLPGEYIEENILTAIGESYRVIILLSKAYLRSKWCIFEFEQAYLRAVSNPLFRLVVVLIENPRDLCGLTMPPLVRAHLRTHTYISKKDILFLEKLRAALPRYPVRRAREGIVLVRGGSEDIVQDEGDVMRNV